MVIGKTSSSISKAEIFSKISETQVLTTVFPEITEIPCLICSPLRADNHPSFSIYMDNSGHIRYKDHSTSDHGGLVDLLCNYWQLSFYDTIDRICQLCLKDSDLVIKPKQIKTFTRKEVNTNSKIQVTIRPWRDYDYQYWQSYGITRQWLHYAEIYPIAYKIITKKTDNKLHRYVFPTDKYAYCFVERKEGNTQLKIYQPYNTNGYKWCSKMDSSVIGLWTKIPQKGDKVVICSSLKDALCLSCQLHIPSLCLQGEGYSISQTAIKELKDRYKKIFICFDTDQTGITDSKKLSQATGFISIIPDLGDQKDLSDYYKSLEDKTKFKQLQSLFT